MSAQQLPGMPLPWPLAVTRTGDGRAVAVHAGPVLLSAFGAGDLEMRDLTICALTEGSRFRGKTIAAAFGILPSQVSRIRSRYREHGARGLARQMGRPPILSPARLRQARTWAGQNQQTLPATGPAAAGRQRRALPGPPPQRLPGRRRRVPGDNPRDDHPRTRRNHHLRAQEHHRDAGPARPAPRRPRPRPAPRRDQHQPAHPARRRPAHHLRPPIVTVIALSRPLIAGGLSPGMVLSFLAGSAVGCVKRCGDGVLRDVSSGYQFRVAAAQRLGEWCSPAVLEDQDAD